MQGLASDKTSLILFPMPLEFIKAFAHEGGAGTTSRPGPAQE